MQVFKDSKSGEVFAFEDDVQLIQSNGVYSFRSPTGQDLNVPTTLQPYTVPAPTAAELLADAQSAKISELRAACQSQILSGYQSSALGSPHTYPSGATDQQNMIASVTASLLPNLPAGWTTPFWCQDASGTWTFVDHTAAQIQQAGSDGKAAIITAQQKLATLTAQVMASTDVQSITW